MKNNLLKFMSIYSQFSKCLKNESLKNEASFLNWNKREKKGFYGLFKTIT